MASNLRTNQALAKNFPKGSYSSYTSFLKQYSTNKSSSPVPSLAGPVDTPSVESPKSRVADDERRQSQEIALDRMSLDQLMALSNGEIELLDINVLRQFAELLNKLHQRDQQPAVDDNNNAEPNLASVDIEKSKQTLIESLKAQLERYRRD